MSIGNDQFFVSHLFPHGIHDVGIRELPSPVRHSIFIRDVDGGLIGRSQQGIDFTGILI